MTETPETPAQRRARIARNVASIRAQGGTDDDVHEYMAEEGDGGTGGAGPVDWGIGRSVAQGAAFGLADEVEAGVGALLDQRPFRAAYDDRVRAIREGKARYEAAHPTRAMLGELAGGLATSVAGGAAVNALRGAGTVARATGAAAGRSLAKRTITAAGTGAVTGGATAFGQAEGGVGQRGGEAGWGALLGAGLGGAAVPATGALSRAFEQPMTRARRVAADWLARDGVDPAIEAAAAARGLVPRGEMVMDAGDNARALAGVAARTPSRARATIRDALLERQRGQGGRVRQAFSEGLQTAEPGDVVQEATDLAVDRLRRAKPRYESAWAAGAGGIDDVDLRGLMDQPFAAAAWRRAQRLAKAEGHALPEVFDVQRARGATLDQFGRPVDAEHLVARQAPDAKALHYWKLALEQELAERGARPLEAGGVLGAEAHVIRGQLGQLRDRLRKIPEYRTASDQYAGDLAEEGALGAGQRAWDEPTLRTERFMRGADGPVSETARDRFRMGAMAKLGRITRETDYTHDVGRKVWGSEDAEQFARALAPDAAGFDRIAQQMGHEQRWRQSYTGVVGNSATAERLAADAEARGGLAGDAVRAAAGGAGGMWTLLASRAGEALSRRVAGVSPAVADALGALLTAGRVSQADYARTMQLLASPTTRARGLAVARMLGVPVAGEIGGDVAVQDR